jgi:hypothetical protein
MRDAASRKKSRAARRSLPCRSDRLVERCNLIRKQARHVVQNARAEKTPKNSYDLNSL